MASSVARRVAHVGKSSRAPSSFVAQTTCVCLCFWSLLQVNHFAAHMDGPIVPSFATNVRGIHGPVAAANGQYIPRNDTQAQ